LGGRQTVSNLGPWLLHMPALRRVTVPDRSAAQDVLETLELRNGPRQVEVVEDPDKPTFSDIDSDAFSWCDIDSDEDEGEGEGAYWDSSDSIDDFIKSLPSRRCAGFDVGGRYDEY
jgi:hypothetical protein